MKKIILAILRFAARQVLHRYQPEIISVTGSVGKTSTKRAIAAVLGGRWRARASIKSYNDEIGVPLAILDAQSPGRSAAGWFRVLVATFWELVTHDPNYPDVLILEMGADHPGDIRRLLRIASPRIGVLTAVTPAHTAFFSSLDALAEEKASLLRALPKDGVAIVSRDNERAFRAAGASKARCITFGLHDEAEVRALDVVTRNSVTFKLAWQGSEVPVRLPGVVGLPAVAAALSGAAVGIAKGMNLIEISEALGKYVPPPSRLTVLSGIKGTTLIDDSYNASPAAMAAALDVLRATDVPGRKIAVLGDMLELGAESRDEHRRAGALAASAGVDVLVGVGERVADLLAGARDAGMRDEQIVHFAKARDAGKFVQDKLLTGDVVLVKGSQGIRLERVVVELMAEPLRAPELVCRNDPQWLRRS